ncbi:hypothetical protein M8J76_013687 [Diaphorina citri]|nr:hypothetical protein M8J76_013687 [Diaphorina citri]
MWVARSFLGLPMLKMPTASSRLSVDLNRILAVKKEMATNMGSQHCQTRIMQEKKKSQDKKEDKKKKKEDREENEVEEEKEDKQEVEEDTEGGREE